MTRADLISPLYLAEQVLLHSAPRGYGGKGDKWAGAVLDLAQKFDCWSILDYGCGEGALARAVLARTDRRLVVREYDPAIAGKDARPAFADLVCCTDVLEHVEPDKLDAVLAHLHSLARRVLFVVIATRPSNKTLSDGRNAHLILESGEWWQARMEAAGFTVQPEAPKSPLKKPSREWVAVLTC
jgi:hypothetical protein